MRLRMVKKMKEVILLKLLLKLLKLFKSYIMINNKNLIIIYIKKEILIFIVKKLQLGNIQIDLVFNLLKESKYILKIIKI